MSVYTVKKVAKLSGVSARALHHYDEIGLLKPACVGANGYRYYGRDELLRLQQILFHPELGFPLEQIRQVLSAPEFDRLAALRAHRERLKAEVRRYQRLVRTLDATLAALEGNTDMDDLLLVEHAAVPRWVASFLYSMCSCRSPRLTALSVLATAACSSLRRLRVIVSAFR
jgi:DNA-binding transcriptional MerR regulator